MLYLLIKLNKIISFLQFININNIIIYIFLYYNNEFYTGFIRK